MSLRLVSGGYMSGVFLSCHRLGSSIQVFCELHSDQGTICELQVVADVSRFFEIHKMRMMRYNPRSQKELQ